MKMGNKFSNRTKVLGGTALLLTAATIVTVVKDRLGLKEKAETAVEEITEGISEIVEDVVEVTPDVIVDTIV